MALDATLSCWEIMIPRSCLSQRDAEGGYRNTEGFWALVVLTSTHQCPGCTRYLVHSRILYVVSCTLTPPHRW
jgi:tRNA(Arg) A34 adenosine deaminase TadA